MLFDRIRVELRLIPHLKFAAWCAAHHFCVRVGEFYLVGDVEAVVGIHLFTNKLLQLSLTMINSLLITLILPMIVSIINAEVPLWSYRCIVIIFSIIKEL